MSKSVVPLRTERNFELMVLASHVNLMVEGRLMVFHRRLLLTVDLILLFVHLGLVPGTDLSTSLVNLTASLMDLTIVLTNLSVIPVGSGAVVLLDSGLTGTTGAGTNLSIELSHIDISRHRYREDKG